MVSTAPGRVWLVVTMNDVFPDEKLIIREYQHPKDYAQVIALWKNAGPGIHLRQSDEANEISKKLQHDPDLFLLAEINHQIIGSVLGGFDGRRGMVYHLAVDEQYRRRGLGAALMAELEKHLKTKGCLRSYLLVTRDNIEAIHFYENLGWEQMDLLIYGKNL
jgi:ribosomal protein S18 acetylase RimI-like enzyme